MEHRLIILKKEKDDISKIVLNKNYKDDVYLDDILLFEKSLKENPNPKMYSADEVMKELREIIKNIQIR